jgi:hypothetical protein
MKNPDQKKAPLNDLVEYIPHRFNRSRGADKTPFQGWPTDEIDRTWLSAYAPGILSSLTPSQASLLPDTTTRIPVPGRENEYQATVDVFHQMHCLDVVRMALYRNRYDKHFYFQNGTVDECKWVHVGLFPPPIPIPIPKTLKKKTENGKERNRRKLIKWSRSLSRSGEASTHVFGRHFHGSLPME